jgi:DNA-binding CsgD family transcriptional regulator
VIEIVGREEELASIETFVAAADEGAADALVLVGSAGIGKSTLWLAGVGLARTAGLRVLSARPAEGEEGLAYAGLGDLFEDVLADVLPLLSKPRRRALETALLVDDAEGGKVEDRAVAVATRDALTLAGEDLPLFLAIDDAQWLDAASRSALTFALRRLEPGTARVFLAQRSTAVASTTLVDGAFQPERVVRVGVSSLSVGALHRVLRDRLDRAFARQTIVRIHERSGGNPFFALQIARLLGEDVDPLVPLPVPDTLEEVVRARLQSLPRPTRRALALAAALGTPSLALLERAGVTMDELEPAFAHQVVERDHSVIRFTHPLLSSVLYADLGDERAGVHEQLVTLVEDPLARARHLALACSEPDAAIAEELDDVVGLAHARGASALAAEVAEHAHRLTPADAVEDKQRRALAAARAHLDAGEWPRAQSLARAVLDASETASRRAEALIVLSEIEVDDNAVSLLERAGFEAAGLPELELTIGIRLAWAKRFRSGFDHALVDARAVLPLLGRVEDDRATIAALDVLLTLGAVAGDPEADSYRAHAKQVAARTSDVVLQRWVAGIDAETHARAGRLDEAREHLHVLCDEGVDRNELDRSWALGLLAWVELWSGRWTLAAEHAAEAREISLQYEREKNQDYIASAWIALYRGELAVAVAEAERGLELSDRQIGFRPPLLLAVRGLAAAWTGDVVTALEILGAADDKAAELGWHDARQRVWTPDLVEALLEAGRRDEAAATLEAWERDAVFWPEWVSASARRCRGLAAAARGAVADGERLLQEAVEAHDAVGDVFGRSRAQLSLGVVRRRLRQKRSAREAIEAALAGFELLGASTWVEKARAELQQIGGRRREHGLTAAERRVAELVAQGQTNREVAAALFLGERTVASHLTHIYAKLGVRSRTELARKVQMF